jgi:hypothetical protein
MPFNKKRKIININKKVTLISMPSPLKKSNMNLKLPNDSEKSFEPSIEAWINGINKAIPNPSKMPTKKLSNNKINILYFKYL